MSNPEFKCATCQHKLQNSDPSAHCYMFQALHIPDGECMQHTSRPKPSKQTVSYAMLAAQVEIMCNSTPYNPST
jgi:hypothetical protein